MICTSIFKFFIKIFWHFIFLYYLCTRFRPVALLYAQMAESVDALVSNTSGATRAGSTPALGTSCTTTCWSKTKQSAVSYLQHFLNKSWTSDSGCHKIKNHLKLTAKIAIIAELSLYLHQELM